MKLYEIVYHLAFPLLPAFLSKVRKDIKNIVIKNSAKIKIIDIGGRKSPYSIGLNAEIIIVDKHPGSDVQKSLNLGLNEKNIADIKKQRSNIKRIILHDMTKPLTDMNNECNVVLCIEVIEHIKEARTFIKNISEILKPDGILYLTTPNGDYIKNESPNFNPDHVKHYTKNELKDMLSEVFQDVSIEYGIKTGKHRVRSLKSWNYKRPLQLLFIWISSIINKIESFGIENTSEKTAHLFAVCKEKNP